MRLNGELKANLKKLFIGEICLAIGYAINALAIALMLMMGRVFNDAASFVGADMSSSALFVCAGVLQLAAIVLIIMGSWAAGQEEPLFKSSMQFFVLCLLAALIERILPGHAVLLAAAAEAAKIVFATIAVIKGVNGLASVAEKQGKGELAAGNHRILKLVVYLSAASLALVLISAVMEAVAKTVILSVLAGIALFLIAAAICGMYANELSKAVNKRRRALKPSVPPVAVFHQREGQGNSAESEK